MAPRRFRVRNRQSGFTLAELTVSLLVVVQVLLAVLMLFDFSNKVSHVQSNIADMQQSLRVSQNEMSSLLRMAGRGGLTFMTTSPGGALWVRDNVAAGSRIGDATSPQVVTGTDVLTVRGVFSTPIYQIPGGSGSIVFRDASNAVTTNMALATTGTLTIPAQTTPDGLTLQSLADAVSQNISEALILEDASNPGLHAVVELLPGSSSVTVATQAVLTFRIRGSATDKVTSYVKLVPGGTYPTALLNVSSVGILEEWRFYVRASTTTAPKLTKARFLPGTDTAYGPPPGPGVDNTPNLAIEVADDVLDLQTALALDTPNHVARALPPGAPAEPAGLTTIDADPVNGYISEAADGLNDDWLYNNTTDDITNAAWANATLYWVRVSLLVRTDRRDPQYQAPLLGRVEDHTYTAGDALNARNERMYRRRILQTVMDVRNL